MCFRFFIGCLRDCFGFVLDVHRIVHFTCVDQHPFLSSQLGLFLIDHTDLSQKHIAENLQPELMHDPCLERLRLPLAAR